MHVSELLSGLPMGNLYSKAGKSTLDPRPDVTGAYGSHESFHLLLLSRYSRGAALCVGGKVVRQDCAYRPEEGQRFTSLVTPSFLFLLPPNARLCRFPAREACLVGCDCRTDWAKVSTESEDSSDLPADATESALHNALTDMHRSGANVQTSSAGAGDDFDVDTSTMPGESSSIALSII